MRSMTPEGADGRAVASISTDPPNVENDKVMVPAALVLDGASAAFTAKSQDDLRNTALGHTQSRWVPIHARGVRGVRGVPMGHRHLHDQNPTFCGQARKDLAISSGIGFSAPTCQGILSLSISWLHVPRLSQVHPSSTEEFTKVDHCY